MTGDESERLRQAVREAYAIELTDAEVERAHKVAAAVRKVLDTTAEASLFDTEPSNLETTLIALAKGEVR